MSELSARSTPGSGPHGLEPELFGLFGIEEIDPFEDGTSVVYAKKKRGISGEVAISIAAQLDSEDERHAELFGLVKERIARPSASRFSTQACIAWGRSMGWKLLDREQYDHRLKRHHDLIGGADAMFETPTGIVLVQGAGKAERGTHWDRYVERDGPGRCQKFGWGFVYVEFERNQAEPLKTEWWAEER